MEYEVRLETVEPRMLAAARGRCTTMAEIPAKIRELLDQVWPYVKEHKIQTTGINVVLYRPEPEGLQMEAGAWVTSAFPESPQVVQRSTPGGMVATTTHVGPYQGIPAAHDAIAKWCRDNHRERAGPNWEVYGHWTDDPAKLQTDIFHLLR
jgi:effector-binding domain-containing protein